MVLHGFAVGPKWPARGIDYDYLLPLVKQDWAWEVLRRIAEYCRDAREDGCIAPVQMPEQPSISMSHATRRSPKAEHWGMISFRFS
jgi:hypothetical protein